MLSNRFKEAAEPKLAELAAAAGRSSRGVAAELSSKWEAMMQKKDVQAAPAGFAFARQAAAPAADFKWPIWLFTEPIRMGPRAPLR